MNARLTRVALVTATVVAGGAAGCAHARAAPDDVARDFARALERGDADRAYALMADGYRRRVSLAQFRRDAGIERELVAQDAAVWTRGALAGGHAEVVSSTGDVARLELTRDGWRLAEQPLAPFAQDSPRAALRAFVRAVEQRRYDVILRLAPARRRASITEATLRAYWEGPGSELRRRLIQTLRAHLADPIVDLGAEATMPYGQGARDGEGEVRFVQEEGIWKIDDVE